MKIDVVIDHIQAGKSMELYKYLGLDQLDCSIAMIQNARSEKLGRKDIIKIDGCIDINLNVLGFLDPNITVNIIEGSKIIEKRQTKLPEKVTNVVRCKNPRCISSIEQDLPQVFKCLTRKRASTAVPTASRFTIVNRKPSRRDNKGS